MFRTWNPRGARALFASVATFATLIPALPGCSDESRTTGTQVEYDAVGQKTHQDKMREFMQKKMQGKTSGSGQQKKRT